MSARVRQGLVFDERQDAAELGHDVGDLHLDPHLRVVWKCVEFFRRHEPCKPLGEPVAGACEVGRASEGPRVESALDLVDDEGETTVGLDKLVGSAIFAAVGK